VESACIETGMSSVPTYVHRTKRLPTGGQSPTHDACTALATTLIVLERRLPTYERTACR